MPYMEYTPAQDFYVAETNMLASKNPHGPNVSPHGPNASRWNIGRVGSPRMGARIGHIHFMMFVLISFVLGTQMQTRFFVEYYNLYRYIVTLLTLGTGH